MKKKDIKILFVRLLPHSITRNWYQEITAKLIIDIFFDSYKDDEVKELYRIAVNKLKLEHFGSLPENPQLIKFVDTFIDTNYIKKDD